MENKKQDDNTLADFDKEQQIRLEKAKLKRIKAETKKNKQLAKERRVAWFSKLPKPIQIIIPILVFVLAVAIVTVVIPIVLDNDKTQYVNETSLKEAVNIESLDSVEYIYKGIAENDGQLLWMDTVDYRVKYEAHIRATYDMSKIEFTIDEENKVATAYLPEAEIETPVLDETKFGYLPENTTADMKDILSLCKEDAANDVDKDKIHQAASDSLKNTINALTLPLLGDDWTLEFKSLSEYPNPATQEVNNEVE